MLFLTPDELRDLSNLQRPSAIRRWLDRARITYIVAADGWPKVLREHVTQTKVKSREPELHLCALPDKDWRKKTRS
jgi:hypothetical protein